MSQISAQARRYYDARIDRLRLVADEPRPHNGWIRAIRDALGMSSTELASRMDVGQPTISGLERSEIRGTIKLDTLRRAAAALDCDLIYYLAPRTTLEDAVSRQARHKATEQLDREAGHLSSDDETAASHSDRLDELALHYVDRKGLWAD